MTKGDCTICNGTGWRVYNSGATGAADEWVECRNCLATGNLSQKGNKLPKPKDPPKR